MVIESKSLFITLRPVFLPPILMLLLPLFHSGEVLSAIFWRILPEAFDHLFVGNASSWHEFNQRKSIEPNQVSQEALPTGSTVITVMVDQ
jgi:hypothetical protein